MVDDWKKLSAARHGEGRDGLKTYQKLLFQVGLGMMLAIFIYRHGDASQATESNYFNVLSLPLVRFDPATAIVLPFGVFIAIGALVISATSNAVNLTDGMDGLAGGCMVVCAMAFLVLTEIGGKEDWAAYLLVPHVPGADELSIVCGALMGACLGFLWYNCYPAQVFMGDTGSLPLGGVLGYVAIVLRQEYILLIVGGIFVIEALSVMIQVGYYKKRGKRVFRMAPIHHHFHLGGWQESQVVVRFWLASVLFAILALVTVKLR
jgi:phospho-N-acetylmuramoyl-pentapeptide-transferase